MEAELRALFSNAMEHYGASQSISVQHPNVAFDKPTGSNGQYFKLATLPVKPSVHTVCGVARYRWILQVSIYFRDGFGEIKPLIQADKIRDEVFPVNTILEGSTHSYRVMTPPYPAPPIPMDGWFSVPVSFTIQTIQ